MTNSVVEFVRGRRVVHPEYGVGIVLSVVPDGIRVAFEPGIGRSIVLPNVLTIVEDK